MGDVEPVWGTPEAIQYAAGGRVEDRKPRRMTVESFERHVETWVSRAQERQARAEVYMFQGRLARVPIWDLDAMQAMADEWVSIRGKWFGKRRPILLVRTAPTSYALPVEVRPARGIRTRIQYALARRRHRAIWTGPGATALRAGALAAGRLMDQRISTSQEGDVNDGPAWGPPHGPSTGQS